MSSGSQRPELVIMCGLQASGKSTYVERHYADTHAYVSKDRMRNVRYKERRQATLVGQYLADGRPVVVDNTNPTVEERRRLIVIGRRAGARVVGYWVVVPVSEALARNARRPGRAQVPEVGILATAKRFEPPTPGEGYDELSTVRPQGDGAFVVAPFRHPA